MYIDEWYTRTTEEARRLWESNTMPLTVVGIRQFQMKFGVGQLCQLFGGRSYHHLLNYSTLSHAIWAAFRRVGIPDMAETFTLARYEHDQYVNVPYHGEHECVRACLTRHLDDEHDLYQNLPYYIEEVWKLYSEFDRDMLLDECIIAAIRGLS